MDVSGNTILITGGATGIGNELARQFLALGNTVIVTGRDQAKLDAALKRSPALKVFRSDVSDPAAIAGLHETLTREFPGLNVLINNAGIMRKINLQRNDHGLDHIADEIEINLNGPVRMVQQFLPHLKSKAHAAIVNVSSGLAFVPLPISPVYCATKAGLHSYTQSLRLQLKKTAVQVFELAPPLTETPLLGGFAKDDTKGVTAMSVEALAGHAIQGMKNNVFEIRPGQSNQLKFMSRVAPDFILKMMGKSVDGMLAQELG